MGNDLIHLVCEQAADAYGGTDGQFSAANFSVALKRIGLSRMDGRLVRLVLCGRSDVEYLGGGCHYRLREPVVEAKLVIGKPSEEIIEIDEDGVVHAAGKQPPGRGNVGVR